MSADKASPPKVQQRSSNEKIKQQSNTSPYKQKPTAMTKTDGAKDSTRKSLTTEKKSPEMKSQESISSTADVGNLTDNPHATILRLCRKNEWGQADSILRTLTRDSPEINFSSVSKLFLRL